MAGGRSALHVLDLTTSKDRVVVEGLSTTTLPADGAKVAYRRDGAWWMALTIDAASAVKVDLAGLQTKVDPHLEWAEMFENAWRLDRDVFFSQAMNGDDWSAVHKAHAKLVPELSSEDDFLWLLRHPIQQQAKRRRQVFTAAHYELNDLGRGINQRRGCEAYFL